MAQFQDWKLHVSSPLWCDLTNPLKLPCPPGLRQIRSVRGFTGAAGESAEVQRVSEMQTLP